jgi:hypothetical protein
MMTRNEYEKSIKEVQNEILLLDKDVTKSSKVDGHEFRSKYSGKKRLNLSAFNQILEINETERWVDVGGMIKYDDLAKYMIYQRNAAFLPVIVPELLSITVGGAISGVALETSSFKHGFVHDSCLDMDILTSDGKLIYVSPQENSDLFYGIPNSYGTLGYILRAKMKIMPSTPYVQVRHTTFNNIPEALRAFEKESNELETKDYLEGIVFKPNKIHFLTGTFVPSLPSGHELKDFNLLKPFYKSIEDGDIQPVDYLDVYCYLSRWDVDGFWGTENTIISNSTVRYYFRNYLKTEYFLTLTRNSWFQYVSGLFIPEANPPPTSTPETPMHYEKITTDNGIPVENWQNYLDWYFQTFPNSSPVWLCSVRSSSPTPLIRMRPNHLYCDFGTFGYAVPSNHTNKHYYNEILEAKIFELGGTKCFYALNCDPAIYDSIVDHAAYLELKKKYDPNNKFPYLKDKVFV